MYAQSGFFVDQFTGADYILLSHVHGDHCNLTGELWNRFYGRVLVPAECAEEIAKVFDIPYAAIYPLYPGNTYYFDDFTLKVYPGAHDNRAFREGKFQRPSDARVLYDGSEGFGLSCPCRLGPLGSMFNFNYVIETKNNYRIDFSAGRDYEDTVSMYGMKAEPDVKTPDPQLYAGTYANMIEQMGAQLAMPLHHNNARATGEDLNAYFKQVNEILKQRGSTARAFNPEPYKWYQICTSILPE